MVDIVEKYEYDSPKARGERIRELRNFLKVTRESFAIKHKFKKSTFQAWETGRFEGIPGKSAKLVAEAFQKEGIDCKPEWIFYGVGDHPLYKTKEKNDIQNKTASTVKQLINKEQHELSLFLKNNKDSVDAVVKDNSLSPFYQKYSHVAGIRQFDKDIINAVNSVCIIKTLSGDSTIMVLQEGSVSERYNLCKISNNSLLEVEHKDVELIYAAPISWMRLYAK